MKLRFVKCPGESHNNVFIGHCGLCMPLWAEVIVPHECETWEAYEQWLRAGNKPPSAAIKKRFRIFRDAIERAYEDAAMGYQDGPVDRDVANAIAAEVFK